MGTFGYIPIGGYGDPATNATKFVGPKLVLRICGNEFRDVNKLCLIASINNLKCPIGFNRNISVNGDFHSTPLRSRLLD